MPVASDPAPAAAATPDEALLEYAGLFAQRTRSAAGLAQLLGRVFGDPIAVEPCVGRWLPLAAEDESRIGPGGRNRQLGATAMAGRRLWDAAGAFRVRIGPVAYGRFLQWLPHTPRFRTLARLTRRFVGIDLDFDVQVVVDPSGIPPSTIAAAGSPTGQIGRTARIRAPGPRPDTGAAELAPIFRVDGLGW
jgi:type VI secretion system protein ImpH